MPCKIGDQGIDKGQGRYEQDKQSYSQDQADGLYAEGRDPVKSQGQHLLQGIFGLPGHTLLAVIVYAVSLVANQRHHAPQEKICLLILGELLHGTLGHQPEIGMIVHRLHAHGSHQLIEPLGSHTLEKGIRFPGFAHPIYNVTASMELVNHLLDYIHIILQICVNGDRHITHVLCCNQPCRQCELMSHISSQLHTIHRSRVCCMFLLNQFPCPVLAAIIYKQDKTVRCNLPLFHQILQHPPKGL